ncbi:hypothetical protein ONZ43_g2003 [Nemania bipapillata]|uniref:Uncharacterized protein n=1 Tax=Nemania bipapillata TaxID=110536 RepID=A0ACC2J2B5_9PEZI|nr:hypothetical protein ONZ43_g2003 [Nemania bipapillata]
MSNLHLLLRVPSFAKWPLKLHFLAPEVHEVWMGYCDTAGPLRETISVFTDFALSQAVAEDATSTEDPRPWGIHALPLDYAPMKDYVEKTQSLYSFEREGACVVCGESLPHDEGLYATCPNEGSGEDIIPIAGRCPECGGEVIWGDMMKEMSLRLRGQKEVDKLLRKPRKRKPRATDDLA